LTNIFTISIFYLFQQNFGIQGFKERYPLLDPMRFFAQAPDLLTTVQPIREELNTLFRQE
jgi:hypothetical protein